MSELWSATYINAQVEEVCGNFFFGGGGGWKLGFFDAGIVRYYKHADSLISLHECIKGLSIAGIFLLRQQYIMPVKELRERLVDCQLIYSL